MRRTDFEGRAHQEKETKSSQPATGYDYDTFADDLHALVTTLDLRDLALVGHSTGSGEVAGYIGKYGMQRLSRAVFVSALPPFLLKTPDNPTGADGAALKAKPAAHMLGRRLERNSSSPARTRGSRPLTAPR